MNASSHQAFSENELLNQLNQTKKEVINWLQSHQVENQPFGHFRSCTHAYAPDELDAATAGIELWVALELPISEQQKNEAIQHLKSYQNPDTGLVIDPTWQNRQINDKSPSERGDTFFTMTACEALTALGTHFEYPIQYIIGLSPEELISATNPQISALSPFAIGDYAALVAHNCRLNIPNALEQWNAVFGFIRRKQDKATGLWPKRKITHPYTPAINRAFHFLRSTWNLVDYPYRLPGRMINTCLEAANDPDYYGWNEGDACNDLDIAFILYSASCWSRHRLDEIRLWAARQLPHIFRIQKPDGGFSYKHNKAMYKHNKISMSPGLPEGDIWGTLMNIGTIKMMTELAYPDVIAPWKFSQVHRVPKKRNPIQTLIAKMKRSTDFSLQWPGFPCV